MIKSPESNKRKSSESKTADIDIATSGSSSLGKRKANSYPPHPNSEIIDNYISSGEDLNTSWQTPEAREVFQEIKRFCNIQQAQLFSQGIEGVRQIIKKYPQALNQINFNGMTLLDIALSMPKMENGDRKLAIRISEVLFDTLVRQMIIHLSAREFKIILASKNKNNFMLLQRAISSGSPTIVNKIIDLLREKGNEQLFNDNLNNISFDGFSCLQQAYMTGNREIIDKIWDILLMQEYSKALYTNLSAITFSGFSVLTSILRHGTDQDFQLLTSVFLDPTYKTILHENLKHISVDRFTILLSAIRSGSVVKVRGVIGLLSLIDDPKVTHQNLATCNSDNYSPISSCLATGSLEMLELVMTFYVQTRNAQVLRDHLQQVTKDQSNPLQLAISAKCADMIVYFIQFLQRKENKPFLDQYLTHRTGPGFMVLQDLIKAGELDVFQQFVPLFTAPANRKALILNLSNFTRAGFPCLGDAIKSKIPEMVDFVVNQSEEHLDKEKWREILAAQFGLNKLNCLQYAVNTGNVAIVDSLLRAIHKAFGARANETLREMLKDADKLFTYEDTLETRAMVAKYLPSSSVIELERPGERIIQSLTATLMLKNEKEFNASFESIRRMITLNPEALTKIGKTGWTVLNTVLRNADKYQSDTILAEKMAVKLFFLLWEHMQRLPREQFHNIIRSQRTDARSGLLLHVLTTDYPAIADMVTAFYSQIENQELLHEQLSISDGHNCFLSKVMLGKSIYNVKKALALLTIPGNEWHFRSNFSHRGKEGFMVLHDGVRKGSPDIFNSLVDALKKEANVDLLVLNLQNITDQNFTLLHDAANQGNDIILRSVIELSEQYLDSTIWRQRLTAINWRGYNILHEAVNHGTALSVGLVFHAIVRAFGRDSRRILGNLLYDWKKFQNSDNKDVLDQLMAIYPYSTTRPLKRKLSQQVVSIQELTAAESSDSEATFTCIQEKTADFDQEESSLNRLDLMQDHEIEDIADTVADFELKKVIPCGGIHDKYLGGAIPSLPKPLHDQEVEGAGEAQGGTTYLQEYALHTMSEIKSQTHNTLRKLLINKPCFQAVFYGAKPISSREPVTFVIAGRKANALIPHPHQGRCVLVLTEQEYPKLKGQIPVGYDTLVLVKLSSSSHGEYNQLGLPTSRRLGAFLFAHFNKLNSFAMIDDNIKKVKFNSRNPGWDYHYRLLEGQLNNQLCISVPTFTPFSKIHREGELGSKLFMMNMKLIREKLPTLPEIFSLFPCAANAGYWGEDYYMQIMFHVMSDDNTQGYEILDPGISCLVRSNQNRNAFARLGKLARPFDELDQGALGSLPAHCQQFIPKAISLLNEIIHDNIQRYQRHLRYVINANLQVKHALANQLQALHIAVPNRDASQEYDDDFLTRYKQKINAIEFDATVFRPYQIQTMKALGASRGKRGRMILTTASGKTYTQCELMRIAYHSAQPGEHIIVVTPHIKLVEQFFKDFIKFNQLKTTVGEDLWIPPEAIIKVCSNRQSCQVKALLLNEKIKKQTCVLIFCADSFDVLLTEMGNELPNVPVIYFDEYHYYNPTVKRTIEHLGESDTLIVGATATPPKEDKLKPTIYRYSRAQGVKDHYLAPVIADCFNLDYSKENVDLVMEALPLIVKKQFHPGLMDDEAVNPRLVNSKGLIYLPSIKDCDKAYAILKSAGVNCFSIHSNNKQHQKELDQFLKSDEQGVLLAVKMLRIGFNLPALAWAIILQNGTKMHESRSNIEQILGRVQRLMRNKLGYVICFRNVLEDVIKPLLADQPVTFPVNYDYLAQSNVYYMNEDHKWFVSDSGDSKLKRICEDESGFTIQFKIVAQLIKKFTITPDDDENEQLAIPQRPDTLLAELTFGCLEDEIARDILVSYERSKRRRGELSKVIDRENQKMIAPSPTGKS